MTSKFKINNKKDIRWKSGFMSIYDISYLDKYSDLADLISDFIKPVNYLIIDESALGQPVELLKISVKDFKKMSRHALIEFLHKFSDPRGWSKPEEIKEEIDFIKKHLIESESDEFYLMNIDQLEDRVTKITIEAHAYLHYFLILWIEEARLKICQMRKD